MLEFSINGQIITRNDEDPIVRDSQNYVIAYFLGDEEWRSHGTVTAIFKGADGQIFNMILSYDSHYGHSCLVPWEVLTQPWFEVSAFCGNLITANTVKVFTIKSGYDSTRDSRIPTPDVYNQIIEQLNRIEDEVDPDAVKAFVDEYLEGKDFVTESDVESIVETYISEHQSQLKTSVEVTPTLTSGTKIAEIDVDGNSTELFAPEGGGGDSSENPSIALKPTVIFSFDEAYEYDSRFTILEENGFHGDFSIRASDSATSWEVWRSLIDAGHDWSIYSGNVGQTKPANNASVGAWYDYIKSGLDIAEAHGMYSPLFYSASGQMCTGNQKIAADKCGLKYIRAVIYDINNTLTPDTSWIYWSKNSFSNQFKTFIYPISINTGVSSVKTDIDNAIAGGYSICLFSHRYATDSYTEAEYREVVEYVKTKVDSGVLDCLTAREYYDKYRHEYDFQQNLIKEFPLSSLSDTTISSPQSGDVLVFNGEKWVNGYSNTPKNNLFIVAHRGLYTNGIPANTIAAFKNAIRDGFSWIEIDVRRTQDWVFILGHDESMTLYKNGVAETVTFVNVTYSQLQEYTWDSAGNYHVDTLEHTLFSLKNMNVNIIIDDKVGGNSFVFVAPIIKQYGMRDRCLLSVAVVNAKNYLDDLKKFPDIKLRMTYITSVAEFEAVASEISNEIYLDFHAENVTSWSVDLPICLSLGYPIIVAGINSGTWHDTYRKHVINCVAGVMSDQILTYKEFVNMINTDLNVNASMIVCPSQIALNDEPIALNAQNAETGGGYINMYSTDNSVATVTCTQRGENAVSTITPVNDGMCEIYVFNPSMSVPIPCIVANNGIVGLIGDISDDGTDLQNNYTKLAFCGITGDSAVKTISRINADYYSTAKYYGTFYLMEIPEGATRFTANVDTSIEDTYLYVKFYDSSKAVVLRSVWSQTKDITIESNYKYIAIGCRIGGGTTPMRTNDKANEYYDKVVSSVSFEFT